MLFCGLAIIQYNQIEVCVIYSKLRLVLQLEVYAVTKFIVPDWGGGGIKFTLAYGYRIGPPGYIGWRGGTSSITLCRSQLYTPSQGL